MEARQQQEPLGRRQQERALEQALEDIERKRHKRDPFSDKYLLLCLSGFQQEGEEQEGMEAGAGAAAGRAAVDSAVTNLHVRVELIRTMRNALVKETEQAVKHASLEQRGRGTAAAGARGRGRGLGAVVEAEPGAAPGAGAGNAGGEFLREDVYERFQALLEGRAQVDCAEVEAVLQANPNHLESSQLCLIVEEHLQPPPFDDFLQEVLGREGIGEVEGEAALPASGPSTAEATAASVDAAVALFREHYERLADQGLLQGFLGRAWGELTDAGGQQLCPLPPYIPQPMEVTALAAAGRPAGGMRPTPATIAPHCSPGATWPEEIHLGSPAACGAQHSMAWQHVPGAAGAGVHVSFDDDPMSCGHEPAEGAMAKTSAGSWLGSAAQQQASAGGAVGAATAGVGGGQQGDGLWDVVWEDDPWAPFEEQQQGQHAPASLGASPAASPAAQQAAKQQQQQQQRHVPAFGRRQPLAFSHAPAEAVAAGDSSRQQEVIAGEAQEWEGWASMGGWEDEEDGIDAELLEQINCLEQQHAMAAARQPAPSHEKHVPVFLNRALKPLFQHLPMPEAGSDAIEESDSEQENGPSGPSRRSVPSAVLPSQPGPKRQPPIFARRAAGAGGSWGPAEAGGKGGAIEEEEQQEEDAGGANGAAVQPAPAAVWAGLVKGSSRARQGGANPSSGPITLSLDFSAVDLVSLRPSSFFKQQPGGKPKWKPVYDVESLLLKPPSRSVLAGATGACKDTWQAQQAPLAACGLPPLSLGVQRLGHSMLSSGLDLMAMKRRLQDAEGLDLTGWEPAPDPMLAEEDPFGLAGIDLEELDAWEQAPSAEASGNAAAAAEAGRLECEGEGLGGSGGCWPGPSPLQPTHGLRAQQQQHKQQVSGANRGTASLGGWHIAAGQSACAGLGPAEPQLEILFEEAEEAAEEGDGGWDMGDAEAAAGGFAAPSCSRGGNSPDVHGWAALDGQRSSLARGRWAGGSGNQEQRQRAEEACPQLDGQGVQLVFEEDPAVLADAAADPWPQREGEAEATERRASLEQRWRCSAPAGAAGAAAAAFSSPLAGQAEAAKEGAGQLTVGRRAASDEAAAPEVEVDLRAYEDPKPCMCDTAPSQEEEGWRPGREPASLADPWGGDFAGCDIVLPGCEDEQQEGDAWGDANSPAGSRPWLGSARAASDTSGAAGEMPSQQQQQQQQQQQGSAAAADRPSEEASLTWDDVEEAGGGSPSTLGAAEEDPSFGLPCDILYDSEPDASSHPGWEGCLAPPAQECCDPAAEGQQGADGSATEQDWECDLVFEEGEEDEGQQGLLAGVAALPAAHRTRAAQPAAGKRRLEQIETEIIKALWEERRKARLDMQPLMQQLAQQLSHALQLDSAAKLSQLRRACSEGGGGREQQVSEQRCFLALLTAASQHNSHVTTQHAGSDRASGSSGQEALTSGLTREGTPARLIVPGLRGQLILQRAGSSDVRIAKS